MEPQEPRSHHLRFCALFGPRSPLWKLCQSGLIFTFVLTILGCSLRVWADAACTLDQSSLPVQTQTFCQFQCSLYEAEILKGNRPLPTECGGRKSRVEQFANELQPGQGYKSLVTCAGAGVGAAAQNLIDLLAPEQFRDFAAACSRDDKCRLQLARKLIGYHGKNPDGSYVVPDLEVLKAVGGQDTTELMNVADHHATEFKHECTRALDTITKELTSLPSLLDDDAESQYKLRLQRFQKLQKYDSQCPIALNLQEPTRNDQSPSLAKAGQSILNEARAFGSGLASVGKEVDGYLAKLGIAVQCYPPEIAAKIMCYGAARVLLDPLTVAGIGIELKLLREAKLAGAAAKNGETLAAAARASQEPAQAIENSSKNIDFVSHIDQDGKTVWELPAADAHTDVSGLSVEVQKQAELGRPYLDGGRDYKAGQPEALHRAHLVGLGEAGKLDGTIAGKGNYTAAQLKQKVQILRDAGFSDEEVGKLLRNGVAGVDAFESPYVTFFENGGSVKVHARLIADGPQGGVWAEVVDPKTGLKETKFLTKDEFASPVETFSARLALERVADPRINQFREAYSKNSFDAATRIISYEVKPGARLMGEVLNIDGATGQLWVRVKDSVTNEVKAVLLKKSDLVTVRVEPNGKLGFIPAPNPKRLADELIIPQPPPPVNKAMPAVPVQPPPNHIPRVANKSAPGETPPAYWGYIRARSQKLTTPVPKLASGPNTPIEEVLENSFIQSSNELGGGINKTSVVTLTDRTKAVWKPHSRKWGSNYRAEVLAYEIDKRFGFNLVPPTVVREIDGQIGSLQLFKSSTQSGPINQMDLRKQSLFDYLIDNRDRHAGNYLVQADGHVISIDHGLSFTGDGNCGKTFAQRQQDMHVFLSTPEGQAILQRLKGAVSNKKFAQDLKIYLGARDTERMLKRIQYLIDNPP